MASLDQVLSAVSERFRRLEAAVEALRRGGSGDRRPISERYKNIHELVSEGTGWTPITFEGTVTSSSITQPTKVNIRTDQKFFWHGMSAYHDSPGADLADAIKVTFNIKVNGTEQLFHNDLNIAQLLSTTGNGGLFLHPRDGGRLIDPGSSLEVILARASGFSGNTRTFGVVLWGDYLR